MGITEFISRDRKVIGMLIFDNSNELIQKHMERGVYFCENNEYQQAAKEFVIAFKERGLLISMFEIARRGSSSTAYFSDDEKAQCLSVLGSFLMMMIKCYEGMKKFDEVRYLVSRLKEVAEKLSEGSNNLDVETLKPLKTLKEVIASFEGTLGETIEPRKDFISEDTEFSTFKKSFNNICQLIVCPLQPDDSATASSATTSSDSCFIATAAYQTSIHMDLDTFREFRDCKLMPTYFGRKLVSVYYKFGPNVANLVSKNLSIQQSVRKILEVVAILMRKFKITTL